MMVARHFEGAWRWITFLGVLVVGYVLIFLSVFFSLLWLIAHLPDRADRSGHAHEDKKSNT